MRTFFRARGLLLSLLFAFMFAVASGAALAEPMTEQQKIDALIHGVEDLPGAKFIRNGTAYDGHMAASHLRMKLNHSGGRVQTADQFITYIATGSSMSGEPYHVQFANGRTMTSADYFRGELKRLESASATPTPAPAKPQAGGSASGASPGAAK